MAYTRVYAILPVLVDFRKGLDNPRRLHLGPREVSSFEQKRLSFGFRQRIGEAISKIQFGGMAARFAEVAIGLAGYASLRFGDGLDRNLRFFHQFIKAAAGYRIFTAINHGSGFNVTHG